MTLRTCGREKELTELLDQGYWPEVASDDLRAHVNGCLPCQSLILVKQAFSAERAHAAAAARLEPPGVLWWRAQLRRRQAAIETIARPILGAQIFALAIALAAAAIYLASQGGKEFAWLQQLPRALHLEALLPDSLAKYQGETWLVVSLVALLALMSGVVVYFASDKR